MTTRTAVITGTTSGLGQRAAQVVAGMPGWRVVHAVRNPSRLPAGAEHVQVELASLDSVRRAAAELGERYGPVDALVLNAGLRPGRTNGLVAYSTSKLAAAYVAYEAAVRWPQLRVNAFDPGLVASTGLGRHLPAPAYRALQRSEGVLARVAPFAHTIDESGAALAEIATGADYTGRYVEVRRIEASSDESYDPHRARQLWDEATALLDLP